MRKICLSSNPAIHYQSNAFVLSKHERAYAFSFQGKIASAHVLLKYNYIFLSNFLCCSNTVRNAKKKILNGTEIEVQETFRYFLSIYLPSHLGPGNL